MKRYRESTPESPPPSSPHQPWEESTRTSRLELTPLESRSIQAYGTAEDVSRLLEKLKRVRASNIFDSNDLDPLIQELTRRRDELVRNLLHGNPERYRRSSDIFIFDFDDTLFPSSWLKQQVMDIVQTKRPLDPSLPHAQEIEGILGHLDNVLTQLFIDVSKRAKPYIVTASKEGWVETAASNYLPRFNRKIMPFLKDSIFAVPLNRSHEGFKRDAIKKIIVMSSERHGLVRIVSVGDNMTDGAATCMAIRDSRDTDALVRKCIFYMVRPGFEFQQTNYLINQLQILNKIVVTGEYRELFDLKFSSDECQSIHLASLPEPMGPPNV